MINWIKCKLGFHNPIIPQRFDQRDITITWDLLTKCNRCNKPFRFKARRVGPFIDYTFKKIK